MLDERKASILRAVVEAHIRTAQPVGSGHVAGAPEVHVSSATVRNDMAVLEQEGYLVQPHTSAGRVPTEKGYRWFVDSLGRPATLDRAHAQQVRAFFDRAHGELERMLHDTSRLLSGLTDYAAVVVGPQAEAAPVRSVQLVGLAPHVVLVVAVLGNGVVEKRQLELADDPGAARVAAAGAHLAAHLCGQALVAPVAVPASGEPVLDALVTAAVDALTGSDGGDADVYIGGTSRMAAAFDAVETVRSVLDLLEQQLVVVSLLRDVMSRGLEVAIGSETGVANLADCSLVVAPYEVDGEPAGTIGVLGPTRMNYPQALAAVAVVSRRLSDRLSDG
ncbi:MAG: heat-inducible transcription repressor HrcA [Actinobacteria bacterium]|nr:heat-inducible transcription repressor HrcA [Actinomycetota bacterium]